MSRTSICCALRMRRDDGSDFVAYRLEEKRVGQQKQ